MRNFQYPSWARWPYAHLIVLAVSLGAITWRFWLWFPHVFAQDNLALVLYHLDGTLANGVWQILDTAVAERFRPVWAFILWALFGMFGMQDYQPFLAANILLHGLNVTLVFAIAYRLSRSNWVLAFCISLAVATSRFALYQVTQLAGLVEGLALTFFLLMVYSIQRATEEHDSARKWGWLSIIFFFLAIHTHERYIVCAIWLGMAFLFLPGFSLLSRGSKAVLLVGALAAAAFNIFYKKLVLHVIFLNGSGEPFGLNIPRTLEQATQAVLSIFGVNDGPRYLAGAKLMTLHWYPGWIFAAVFIVVMLLCIWRAVSLLLERNADNWRLIWAKFYWPISFLILGALLLGPPILTTHVEQRWLLAPFILLLLILAWATGVWSGKSVKIWWKWAPIVGLIASMAVDTVISKHFGPMFFIQTTTFAEAVKRDIVDKHVDRQGAVAFIVHNSQCKWTLMKGGFFRIYEGKRRDVECFRTYDEARFKSLPPGTYVYSYKNARLKPVFRVPNTAG